MHAALQEDVDVVGVSLSSAAHMTVMPEMLRIRKRLGIEHIPVVLGGIVPVSDHPALAEMGVSAVFNPGSTLTSVIDKMHELTRRAGPIRENRASIRCCSSSSNCWRTWPSSDFPTPVSPP